MLSGLNSLDTLDDQKCTNLFLFNPNNNHLRKFISISSFSTYFVSRTLRIQKNMTHTSTFFIPASFTMTTKCMKKNSLHHREKRSHEMIESFSSPLLSIQEGKFVKPM